MRVCMHMSSVPYDNLTTLSNYLRRLCIGLLNFELFPKLFVQGTGSVVCSVISVSVTVVCGRITFLSLVTEQPLTWRL